ncbi:MAG: heat-shock protein HtpX, partial [Methanobacterium paludis]|nr:heat-shock protein HtpX [Methanobacterium paludis]
MSKNKSFVLDVEISSAYIGEILNFISRNYLQRQPENFKDIHKTRNGLFFTVFDKELWSANVM